MIRAAGVALLAVTALLVTDPAAAQGPSVVVGPAVVVRISSEESPVAQRIVAELRSLGIVSLSEEGEIDDRLPASAAIVLAAEATWVRARVWVYVDGGYRLSELVEAEGEDASEVVAVRAVEILRAALLDAPSPAGDEPPVPNAEVLPVERPLDAERAVSSLRFVLSGAAFVPSSELVPGGGLALSVHARPDEVFGVRISAGVSLASSPIDGRLGDTVARAEHRAVSVHAEGEIHVLPRTSSVDVAFLVGASLLFIEVRGVDNASATARSVDAALIGPAIGFLCSAQVVGPLEVVGQVILGVAPQPAEIRFGGTPVATVGVPWLEVNLGVGWEAL